MRFSMFSARILSGDPSSDDLWTVEVDYSSSPTEVHGRLVRVTVRNGTVTDSCFAHPDDRGNNNHHLQAAEEAVRDAIAEHDARKGFGWHPDVVT